jgi:type III secretory pathway component EscR
MEKITAVELKGFAKWLTRGLVKDVSSYGFLTVVLAILAHYTGCPQPIPMYMAIVGVAVVLGDLIYVGFRTLLAFYRLDRERLLNAIKRQG